MSILNILSLYLLFFTLYLFILCICLCYVFVFTMLLCFLYYITYIALFILFVLYYYIIILYCYVIISLCYYIVMLLYYTTLYRFCFKGEIEKYWRGLSPPFGRPPPRRIFAKIARMPTARQNGKYYKAQICPTRRV